jgi:lipopolysaccharide export system protein LptA
MMKNILKILFFYLLLPVGFLFGQDDKPIELLNTDVLESIGGRIREYRGNVKLRHGIVVVTADFVRQDLVLNDAFFKGNVVLTQQDMILKSEEVDYNGNSGIARSDKRVSIIDSNATLFANRGEYNTSTRIADFRDDVVISDESVTITSDRLRYNRRTLESRAVGDVVVKEDSVIIFSDVLDYHRRSRKSENYGNVIIKAVYDNVYLTADTLLNVPADNYTFSTGKPVLFQIDSTEKDRELVFDTLSISCDTMEAFRVPGDERYVFNRNVEIVRGNLFAVSERAVYLRTDELFFLERAPVVWFDSTQLHADSIIVYIPDNRIEMIHSIGNALAASRDDTLEPERKNQIIGKVIKIFFTDKHIDRIESYGDAKSLYYLASEEGNDGADQTSCDTIYVYFEDGKPRDVVWLGAIEGKYFPENMVWDKVKDYFLPGYRWRDDKPSKKRLGYFR